jgi:hypothetical protein
MTHRLDLEELVGPDLDHDERDRLERVHALLLEAGPPPELSPNLEFPTLAMTLTRPPRQRRRGIALLAAALVTVALAFVAGYTVGNSNGNGLSSGVRLQLIGTNIAPAALASLRVEPVDASGNRPMELAATGLPKLPPRGYYTVWLMRGPKALAPCGTFIVAGKNRGISVTLNAPYRLKPGDWWAVTKQMPGHHEAGPIVLRPQRSTA